MEFQATYADMKGKVMNLYCKFFTHKPLYYRTPREEYDVNDIACLERCLENFLNNPKAEKAYSFMKEYFNAGQKGLVFDENRELINKYSSKNIHAVSLYLLGANLQELVKSQLRDKVNMIAGAEWHQFEYTWFLMSLFHDIGADYENKESLLETRRTRRLEYQLDVLEVQYNPFQYLRDIENLVLFPVNQFIGQDTYCESLIKDYFYFRSNYQSEKKKRNRKIDHGIIAGYLFFDRMKKNYDAAWKERQQSLLNGEKYTCFKHKSLSWRIELLVWFAYIAKSIMAHNIWFSTGKNKNTYKKYNLEYLTDSTNKKVNIKKDPMLFFLGLLDSIEPVKRFECICAEEVWENVCIDYNEEDNQKNIKIHSFDGLKKWEEHYKKWINNIYDMKNWLDITIEPEYKSKVKGKITITINTGDQQC
jgi:hypothetical protein